MLKDLILFNEVQKKKKKERKLLLKMEVLDILPGNDTDLGTLWDLSDSQVLGEKKDQLESS